MKASFYFQLNSFQDQLEYLLKQVGGISTELASGKLSPDLVKDLQGKFYIANADKLRLDDIWKTIEV